jgi:hypothetical protein
MFLTGTSAAPKPWLQRFWVDPERRRPCLGLASVDFQVIYLGVKLPRIE